MKKITSSQIAEQNFKNWLGCQKRIRQDQKKPKGLRAINEIDGRREYVALHNAAPCGCQSGG